MLGNGSSCYLTSAHCQNDGCSTSYDVAASPDARIGSAALFVGLNVAPLVELDARLVCWAGGNMRNAIPFKAEVVLALDKDKVTFAAASRSFSTS